MKLTKKTACFTCAALALAAAQLANAATYKLADKTGASIAAFRDDIVTVKNEANAVLATLDRLVSSAATDPRKSFKEFDKALPRVDDAAKKAKKRAEDIKARGQAYFKDWEKELGEVNNPEIRKLAQERKAKLQTAFDSIKTCMEPARDQFNVWLADLKDLHRYLGADLTVQGIDAARPLIEKTKAEGVAVQQTLDKVVAELNSIVATITPASQAKAKQK